MQQETAPEQAPHDPWGTWGWLMGGVWLGFFIIPLISIWGGTRDLGWQLWATALVLLFIAVYVAFLPRVLKMLVRGERERAVRHGLTGLGLLTLVALFMATQIGGQALTALPFLVSFPVFFMSWRGVALISTSVFAGGVIGSWLAWGPWPSALLWGISIVAIGLGGFSRFLEERQDRHRMTLGDLALSEERERVARDVHDVLGHSLTVVAIKTELAQRLIDLDPDRAKVELAEVQDLARQSLAEIRATVGGLRVARLSEEVRSAGVALAGAGIAAELPQDLEIVDPRYRTVLAWVLREAVTNVARHSGARSCTIQLASDRLTVTDDGRGMADAAEGNGIQGLRERVGQSGGRVTISAGPAGKGTTLEVQL